MIVPNLFPTIASSKRIAVIGEAPGSEEERIGQPFVGASGRFLAALLSRAGISREACFLGNVSQHRPPNNMIDLFPWSGIQIQHGLDKLREDIAAFKPNIVVLLGNIPLKAAKDINGNGKLLHKNSQWRGSLFKCEDPDSPFHGYKCISSYHPAYCLRDYECTPLLQFDLRKAVRESADPALRLPERHFFTKLTPYELCACLRDIRKQRTPIALDIEGGVGTMSCISFATSPHKAFLCPFTNKNGESLDFPMVWRELALTLEDSNVPKVLQNSLYDRFVLHYSYGIRVRGVVNDTMLKHWELYSELEKSLGVQASIYTDEPYYKGERKSDDDDTFFRYCCRDSAVTLEISNKLEPLVSGTSRYHYELNVALLNPLLYMELRGIRYDVDGAKSRRNLLKAKLHEAQARFNALTGAGFSWTSTAEIFARARDLMGLKRALITTFEELSQNSTKAYREQAQQLAFLMRQRSPTLATIGEIEDLCEVSLNVSSNKQLIPYLYETLKLPTQFSMPKDRREEPKPTADYEALLKLARECQKNDADPRLPIIHLAIEIRALGTRQSMLAIGADRDGRIRCGYNIVGSNTGRITCYESPTGSGYNLQTIPNYTTKTEAPGGVLGDRDLFLADPEYWLFQCDLKGADGWTVAAYSAMLGDPTMLDDYLAGLSPFTILTMMLRGWQLDFKDRAALAVEGKRVEKDSWDRFACKRVQHGAAYLEGGLTISRNILKDSEGKLYMSPTECDQLKAFFFQRYWGIKRWHDWVARTIKARPVLTAASGQVRQFFGRTDEILTKAVAFEPQANTTFATNLAMYNLWTDYENRISNTPISINNTTDEPKSPGGTNIQGRSWDRAVKCGGEVQQSSSGSRVGGLRIEPLHQVHDALVGQFRQTDTTWALVKIKQWFDNALQIAGQKITIPFEGGYGPSWGNLTNKI